MLRDDGLSTASQRLLWGYVDDSGSCRCASLVGSHLDDTIKPFTALITRLEYRYESNQNVFQLGGGATGSQPTLSVEAIYLF